ncbi:MAG: thermonuclease family protein [Myxacorys californica WJT36-NPBG1]|nr:thermonuclease family protein [Myxacorys californica WJT36-NPBG1]
MCCYPSTVGEVFIGNKSINLALVQQGSAVVYSAYLKGCSNNQSQYLTAERLARAQRIGFWNQTQPLRPWDFHRGNPSRMPQPTSRLLQPATRKYSEAAVSRHAISMTLMLQGLS